MKNGKLQLWLLFAVTLFNYILQVPYYVRLYYIPHHTLPSLRGVLLLGATLVWFLYGYVGSRWSWRFGQGALVSFLAVEALFYLQSVIFGGFWFQLHQPDLVVRFVYMYGYISGAIAAVYLSRLLWAEHLQRRTKHFGVSP